MYRVLVPVDGDDDRLDSQLDAIRDLPGRDELAVTVLHVHEEIDTPPDEAGSSIIESVNENIEALQGVPETIPRATEALETLEIPTDVRRARGEPVQTILEVAADVDANAILVAGRKRSPVGKAIFGSVTQGVILRGDRPVVVAG